MVLPRQANLGYGYRLESDAHQTGFGHSVALLMRSSAIPMHPNTMLMRRLHC
ncbi:MAG: hypothetical protein V7K48_21325 [Nostoc sp.]|uniref:hypothetical protein n=1 Tax=Nostoc sp. TaxID=1180 RepID=UPI002FFC2611